MNELKNRGLADILIAIVDGLKGFPEAIRTVFPETSVQTCIVHLVRHSLSFGTWKDRETVTSGRFIEPRRRQRPGSATSSTRPGAPAIPRSPIAIRIEFLSVPKVPTP